MEVDIKQEPQSGEIRLGVVIPLANEELVVQALLRGVLAEIGPNDRIYCVIDNKSKDRTRELVQAECKNDPRVLEVWAPENRCVVDAYLRGYREALAVNCAWILEMDGGLSHVPEEIPRFIKAMTSGVDFAAGSRFIRGGSYRGRRDRFLLSWGGTLLANLVLGTRMKDMTSGFECFTHRALSHVVGRGIKSRAHFFQTEIRHMLHDWKWVEIPISYSNPSDSVGKENIFEAIRLLFRIAKESRLKKVKAASHG